MKGKSSKMKKKKEEEEEKRNRKDTRKRRKCRDYSILRVVEFEERFFLRERVCVCV
ncbi:Uncharacterized protein APZ42_021427 [Daphnia magna]|uniref:Uncharacterized protein n=1 Tax=Daphnia magna TaxID=35525 RepID=A0A164WPA6_9CRUS|nr:Uncharacterized protein APZ42_021427 [Daphnia magna]